MMMISGHCRVAGEQSHLGAWHIQTGHRAIRAMPTVVQVLRSSCGESTYVGYEIFNCLILGTIIDDGIFMYDGQPLS